MANTGGDAHFLKGIRVAREGRNPKIHGEIQGYPVGSSWPSRAECSKAGVHAPLRGGIHGNVTDGAYSVVLSGGYEDDEDNGVTITYTGQGGRDTKGSLMNQLQGKIAWEGAQNADQEWVLGNKALKISCTTKKPIRVVRGHTLNSIYAPAEGYRYDGLYVIDAAWRAVGKTGFHTCRFTFTRLPNQPPIPGTRPKTQKATHQIKPKLEPGTKGSAMPKAGPSALRPLALVPLEPARPRLVPSTVTGAVRKSLNKPPVPPTPNRPRGQTSQPRPGSSTEVPLSGLLKRGEDDYYRPKTPSRSSRPPLSSADYGVARAGVAPLQMLQVQRSLKRPRGERVIHDDDGASVKRNISPPQTPRRMATVKGANKFAHLKFKKQKIEN